MNISQLKLRGEKFDDDDDDDDDNNVMNPPPPFTFTTSASPAWFTTEFWCDLSIRRSRRWLKTLTEGLTVLRWATNSMYAPQWKLGAVRRPGNHAEVPVAFTAITDVTAKILSAVLGLRCSLGLNVITTLTRVKHSYYRHPKMLIISMKMPFNWTLLPLDNFLQQ